MRILYFILINLITSFILMILWNYTIPVIFECNITLTYIQALCLKFITDILFKNHKPIKKEKENAKK